MNFYLHFAKRVMSSLKSRSDAHRTLIGIYHLRQEAAYWDARVYMRFFWDWMGFDRETKRHFLKAFLISLAFLWNLVFATVVREP